MTGCILEGAEDDGGGCGFDSTIVAGKEWGGNGCVEEGGEDREEDCRKMHFENFDAEEDYSLLRRLNARVMC